MRKSVCFRTFPWMVLPGKFTVTSIFELVKTVDAAAYGKIPTVFCDPNASGHTLQQAR